MKPKKVLIVDDEPDIRFFLQRGLRNNFLIKEAENLAEGIKVFNEFMPDILVLDVNLPDGNGSEKAAEFRRIKQDVNIIFVSADNDHLATQYSNYQGDGFIKKPFEVNNVQSMINDVAQVPVKRTI